MAKNRKSWRGIYEKTLIKQDEVVYLSLPLRHGDLREDGYVFREYYYRTTLATGDRSVPLEHWLSPESLKRMDIRKAKQKKENTERNRDFIKRYKSIYGCSVCRYKKSLSALHFHHMNSKKLPLSKMHGYSRKSVKEEMRKCILVCANCHSEIHDKEREEVVHGHQEICR